MAILKIIMMSVLLTQIQSGEQKVGRVVVISPYNNGIIFEYAARSIPEDGPLTDDRVKCLISHLMSTGIFGEVRWILKQASKQKR